MSPSYAPVAVTARGGGAPGGAGCVGCRDYFNEAIALASSARPPRRSCGFGAVLPDAGEFIELHPDGFPPFACATFSRRQRQSPIVGPDRDPKPPGRVLARHSARAPHPTRPRELTLASPSH
ncbi:hypothetical protein RPD_1833 [Rhodopseudomonas palustris BisB5]|uniref:Uncharacterized protein n=1 Tax=Rhodopseudomonas palustris (strain BisB5) TaxID=316057 RepID=Q13A20_RHOPS|nr:hypothetical protein RPD_1833 [Rhodopseudomonas palustris BisB5]